MAELLSDRQGIDAAVATGRRGEFSVLVDNRVVARKRWGFYPADENILAAVEAALVAAAPREAAPPCAEK